MQTLHTIVLVHPPFTCRLISDSPLPLPVSRSSSGPLSSPGPSSLPSLLTWPQLPPRSPHLVPALLTWSPLSSPGPHSPHLVPALLTWYAILMECLATLVRTCST